MKRILLFTILCAGQLYGMEQPEKGLLEAENISDLPEDVHKVIVKTLATSNNLEQTIEAIQVAGILQGVCYNNLKDFTKLVHILADKFEISTTDVAKQFNTPTSKKYYDLTSRAIKNMYDWDAYWVRGSIEDKKDRLYIILNQLIKEGLDVNMTHFHNSPLMRITSGIKSPKITQLLLDAGANLDYKRDDGRTALDWVREIFPSPWLSLEAQKNCAVIIQLLERAMQKQLQQQQNNGKEDITL